MLDFDGVHLVFAPLLVLLCIFDVPFSFSLICHLGDAVAFVFCFSSFPGMRQTISEQIDPIRMPLIIFYKPQFILVIYLFDIIIIWSMPFFNVS